MYVYMYICIYIYIYIHINNHIYNYTQEARSMKMHETFGACSHYHRACLATKSLPLKTFYPGLCKRGKGGINACLTCFDLFLLRQKDARKVRVKPDGQTDVRLLLYIDTHIYIYTYIFVCSLLDSFHGIAVAT